MRIAGLLRTSLIDYPGKVAAVIFTQGCNFRCPYCHNSELVLPQHFHEPIEEDEVFEFLDKRKHQLQGIVVTGGEPTIHKDLPDFLFKIKSYGYSVKLDSNGTNPDMLREIIMRKLVNFIAMDIKNSFHRYDIAAGKAINIDNIKESIELIRSSGVTHLFRTTVAKDITSEEDLRFIQNYVEGSPYKIQSFTYGEKVLDSSLSKQNEFTKEEFQRLEEFCLSW